MNNIQHNLMKYVINLNTLISWKEPLIINKNPYELELDLIRERAGKKKR